MLENSQGDKLKQMVDEEIEKAKAIELQTAADQSLKEMLARRKQLKRLQLQSPSQELEDQIAELDLAIALSDENLSLDDAYGLMAE